MPLNDSRERISCHTSENRPYPTPAAEDDSTTKSTREKPSTEV